MRGPRRTHKKEVLKIAPKVGKQKPAPYKKKVAVVVGRAYTLDELGALIASLTGENTDREISGVSEFAENQGAVSEAAAQIPDVSGTDIMELVIAAVLKNEQKMLVKFEKERKTKALSFIAKSESIPPTTRDKALEVLKRVQGPEFQAPKHTEAKEPTLVPVIYTPQQVQILIQKLESKIPELRIPAAIKFISDYPKIAPTVARIPLLTVTEVTIKAVEVIKQDTDKVINIMVQKRMVPALMFLSSLAQVPLDIRDKAYKAAEKLKAQILGPAPKEEAAKVPEAELQKTYSPMELAALLDGLGSLERVRVVWAAKEFLKNYDIIVQAISNAPDISVTQVTDKAMKAIENNLGAVLKSLEKSKDQASLSFLANSAKVPEAVRKKAKVVLMHVLAVKENKMNPFLKLAMDSQDKD
jgi:hypothetical protein